MEDYTAQDALLLLKCLNLPLLPKELAVFRRDYRSVYNMIKETKIDSGRPYGRNSVLIQTTKKLYCRIIPLTVYSSMASIMMTQRPKRFDYELGRKSILEKLARNKPLEQIAEECETMEENDLFS